MFASDTLTYGVHQLLLFVNLNWHEKHLHFLLNFSLLRMLNNYEYTSTKGNILLIKSLVHNAALLMRLNVRVSLYK